jgi:hypothetical protein
VVFIEYGAPLDGQMALMCLNTQKIQGGGKRRGRLIPPHPLLLSLLELTRKLQDLG